MTIRKRIGRLLFASAATAAVVGLCAAPALASVPLSTTLRVKISGGGKFTATAKAVAFRDGRIPFTCQARGKTPASSASGNIPSRSHMGASPVNVGTVTTLKFGGTCGSPIGGLAMKAMGEPYLVAIDSKTNSKGQTDVLINGMKIHFKIPGCSFDVTGPASGFYTNGKHSLTMTPKLPVKDTTSARLTVSHLSGCEGLVKNGNHLTFNGTFTLSRKVTIHSS